MPAEERNLAPAPSLAGAVGDRCGACGTRLAGDQRYCLECGERRGKARFTAIANPPAGGRRADAPPPRIGSRLSAGTTLIAGVATLLLALGIGVLIGAAGHSQPVASGKVQVVTVGGGSGASSGSSAPATQSPAVSSARPRKPRTKGKSPKSVAAASAHTSSAPAPLPAATVTVGASGHGAGYQHGKFTGKFFGP